MSNSNNRISNRPEAEMAVLGAIISDSNNLYDIIEILSPEEFYFGRHRELYSNILEMNKKNIPIDSITIADYLYKKNRLKNIGGISYIMDLENSYIRSENINYYGKIIKDAYKLRTILQVSNDIRKLVYDNIEIDEVINKVYHKLSSLNFNKNSMNHISESLIKTINKIEENIKNGGNIVGIKTNFINLDNAIGGLQLGDLIILSGRPSVGKTTFALNIINEISKKNRTAIFSFKISELNIMERILSFNCNISISKIKNANLDIKEFKTLSEKIDDLKKRNIIIYDSSSLSVDEIKQKCQIIKNNNGLDIIIIDYLQLIKEKESYSKEQQMNRIARELKIMARELNICVIATTQLGVDLERRENKRSTLSDLKEIKVMEQYADLILLLYRGNYFNKDSYQEEICEVLISKNKNGQLKTIKLKWNGDFQLFSNIEVKNK